MKRILFGTVLGASLFVVAAVPEVRDVTMAQAADRLVTITYTLADAPAVVTLDIQTNVAADVWHSIGGENIQGVTGDVWKKVESGADTKTILWRPDLSWPDHKIADGGVRAVVTAWALDNTPDYMVVDISATAAAKSQTYYPAVEFLPGGILSNTAYRTSMIVMRKIMARNVTWTMGPTALETQRLTNEGEAHQVTLTNNYYIGVFPVTQAQWALVFTNSPSPSFYNNLSYRAMRPVEQVAFHDIRLMSDATAEWPAAPNPTSFLGLLRVKTGIDFDLPGEAQWEFAARAGNGVTKWGDGTTVLNADTDANLDGLGRYERNGGRVRGETSWSNPAASCTADNGTSIVGTYRPNVWGLYDMHGNVWEWCLDAYTANTTEISALNGAVKIAGSETANRVAKGGCWNATSRYCRSAARYGFGPAVRAGYNGFRLACTAGLR